MYFQKPAACHLRKIYIEISAEADSLGGARMLHKIKLTVNFKDVFPVSLQNVTVNFKYYFTNKGGRWPPGSAPALRLQRIWLLMIWSHSK
jgi:hypothetical protein